MSGERRENNPNRKVHREVFDRSIVDVGGVPTRRKYVSRYDEGGNFISQGYTHHGTATPNQVRAGTWSEDAVRDRNLVEHGSVHGPPRRSRRGYDVDEYGYY